MIYVYALRNSINSEIYVGITKNLEKRLKEHNSGKSKYTKAYKPWEVFFTETQPDYMKAREREKYFKASSGKRFLRKLL